MGCSTAGTSIGSSTIGCIPTSGTSSTISAVTPTLMSLPSVSSHIVFVIHCSTTSELHFSSTTSTQLPQFCTTSSVHTSEQLFTQTSLSTPLISSGWHSGLHSSTQVCLVSFTQLLSHCCTVSFVQVVIVSFMQVISSWQ